MENLREPHALNLWNPGCSAYDFYAKTKIPFGWIPKDVRGYLSLRKMRWFYCTCLNGVISSQRVDLLLYVRQLSPYFKKLSFDLLVWSWTIVVKVNITAPCWRRSPARYLFLLGRRLSWQGNSTKCCLKEQDTGQYCLDKMHFRLGQWNASETVLMRSHTIEHPTWSRIFCKAIILFGCCDVLWAA